MDELSFNINVSGVDEEDTSDQVTEEGIDIIGSVIV